MVRKNYTDEFRQRAVDLLESTPGATLRGIAGDLGIARGTLSQWVQQLGSGALVSEDAGTVGAGLALVKSESKAARITRLEAENATLKAEQVKLAEERDILRAAAKYFAGETNW
jgi:transposase